MKYPITIHYGASKTVTDAEGNVVDLHDMDAEQFHETRRNLVRQYKRHHNIKTQRPRQHGSSSTKTKEA